VKRREERIIGLIPFARKCAVMFRVGPVTSRLEAWESLREPRMKSKWAVAITLLLTGGGSFMAGRSYERFVQEDERRQGKMDDATVQLYEAWKRAKEREEKNARP
jgi:hypothetical protein